MLSEAVSNYLLRLGWGHGDDEIISREQAIIWFDLAHVGRSPARFDLKKLENVNGHYIRETDDSSLAALVAPRVEQLIHTTLDADQRELLQRAMEYLKPRAKNLNELADGATFLFRTRPIGMDEAASALLDDAGLTLLADVHRALSPLTDWTSPSLEGAVRSVAEAAGIGLGKVAQPLRAALTGRTTSPGIFDVLVLLGREESLGRLGDRVAV
jgi:glutamyl-tRNA synthetase